MSPFQPVRILHAFPLSKERKIHDAMCDVVTGTMIFAIVELVLMKIGVRDVYFGTYSY